MFLGSASCSGASPKHIFGLALLIVAFTLLNRGLLIYSSGSFGCGIYCDQVVHETSRLSILPFNAKNPATSPL